MTDPFLRSSTVQASKENGNTMKESPCLHYEKDASANTHILHLGGTALELGQNLLGLGLGGLEVTNHVESSWTGQHVYVKVGRRFDLHSGMLSPSPLMMALKLLMVSFRSTSLPSIPVKTWATVKGWLRKRWSLRARSTVSLSASDNSSIPRMAMISWRDLYSWSICCTREAVL